MVISSGIASLLHIPLCWILVFKSGLGNKGAALANTISYWINVLFLMLCVQFSPACSKSWTGFSKEALYDVHNFLKLAIPSAIMICLEYLAFEMVVLLSGLLSKYQARDVSVINKELETQEMRLVIHVMVILAVTEGIIVGTATLLLRRVWGKLYSNEEDVIRYVATMLPLLALSNFSDGIQYVVSGGHTTLSQ
ncbi:Detoxification-like protein [Thalictrum thalictroides]|uniref:Detoxification-like protein n=1 Tax=Thalictrum thalictroides TaxID=46969 RepID=A0A7J6VZP6_THATH|nr:Detoxification-like protein [Thalictrum thalictroides]